MQNSNPLVDKYISSFPKEIRTMLAEMRAIIRKAAPDAEEVISYQMPAYKQNGILVFFAAHKKHIGFYPTASGMRNFAEEMKEYKTSKGAVQFPLGKPLPAKLIEKIVQFRVMENMKKP